MDGHSIYIYIYIYIYIEPKTDEVKNRKPLKKLREIRKKKERKKKEWIDKSQVGWE